MEIGQHRVDELAADQAQRFARPLRLENTNSPLLEQRLHRIENGEVVVDHQDLEFTQPGRVGRSARQPQPLGAPGLCNPWHPHAKHRAMAWLAAQGQFMVEQPGESIADGKPQPQSLLTPG